MHDSHLTRARSLFAGYSTYATAGDVNGSEVLTNHSSIIYPTTNECGDIDHQLSVLYGC